MAPPKPTRGRPRSGLSKPAGSSRRRSARKGSTSATARNANQQENTHARNARTEEGTLPLINQGAGRGQTEGEQQASQHLSGLLRTPFPILGSLESEAAERQRNQPMFDVPSSNVQNIQRWVLPEASSHLQAPRNAQEQFPQTKEMHARNGVAYGESSNQSHLLARMHQDSEHQNASLGVDSGHFRDRQSSSMRSPLHMGTQARQAPPTQSQDNVTIYPVPVQRRPGQQSNLLTRDPTGQNVPSASPEIAPLQSRLSARSQPQSSLHSRPRVPQNSPPTALANTPIESRRGVQTEMQTGVLARESIGQTVHPSSPRNPTSLPARDSGSGSIEPVNAGIHLLPHNQTPTAAHTPSIPFQSISRLERDEICHGQAQRVLIPEDSPHLGAAATHRQHTSSRTPTNHVHFSPQIRETTHRQGIRAISHPLGTVQETGDITDGSTPLEPCPPRPRPVHRAQSLVVRNREVLQNQEAVVQPGRAHRDRRERPSIPRTPHLSDNSSLQAMKSLEESMANKFCELFDRIKSLENATISMGENICGALDGARADNDSLAKMVVECQKDVGEKICQSLGTISGTPASENDQNDSDALAKKVSDAQDFVKYTTCVQYLDPEQGQDFYCEFIAQSKAVESPIVKRAAQFVLGDNTDLMEFLKMKRPTKRNGKMILVDNGTLIGRGQGNAQESIRKALIASFTSACPRSSALHTSTTMASDNAKRLLLVMYETAEYKYDTSLADAWRAAQHGSMAAAYKTAKGAHTSLTMQYPGRQITQLPTKPTNVDGLDLSLHKVGFVSFKISKYVESLAIGRKGVHVSHGPAWAQEVLFCNEKLNRALNSQAADDCRTPVFLSPYVHSPLPSSEVERLRLLSC